jgi:hypothetical protein
VALPQTGTTHMRVALNQHSNIVTNNEVLPTPSASYAKVTATTATPPHCRAESNIGLGA